MTRRMLCIGAAALTIAATLPARAVAGAYDPSCGPTKAANYADAAGRLDPDGDVRVYAIQYKQEIRHVETYESFRRKMRCLMTELVMISADANRDGKADRPTIVVFNEDAGLATVATGTRGAAARTLAAVGPKDPQNIPGALSAFASLAPGYAPAIAQAAAREPETSPQRLILAAATDTFVRGFMQVNADIARDFGVYVVSSNNQAEFRETSDPATVAALADPDLASAYASGALTSVYEAVDVDAPIGPPETTGVGRAGIDVYNQAFMWAPTEPSPDDPVQQRYRAINGGPLSPTDPRRTIIAVTRKTPLTPIERDVLDLSDDRDLSPANTGPFHLLPADDPDGAIAIGFGISLPAFQWGTSATGGRAFGTPLNEGVDACGDPSTWMRCLDARGVSLFLQPEANPGRWADYIDLSWSPPAFQSLSWLDSAWRAVADPTVHNIRYAVTPHLVGNLVDLTFDGQSVIFERCLPEGTGDTCEGNTASTFVGAGAAVACGPGQTAGCDDPALYPYIGTHRETVVKAPWVLDDYPVVDPLGQITNRSMLAERSRAMEAGTGSPYENDYLETAIFADLDFD